MDGAIITTFGDMMRVPGSSTSLAAQKAAGRDIRIVYSPLDALDIAEQNPERPVIFMGVGFETTTPTIAAAILEADARRAPELFGLLRSQDHAAGSACDLQRPRDDHRRLYPAWSRRYHHGLGTL